jgi:hypothetical protein
MLLLLSFMCMAGAERKVQPFLIHFFGCQGSSVFLQQIESRQDITIMGYETLDKILQHACDTYNDGDNACEGKPATPYQMRILYRHDKPVAKFALDLQIQFLEMLSSFEYYQSGPEAWLDDYIALFPFEAPGFVEDYKKSMSQFWPLTKALGAKLRPWAIVDLAKFSKRASQLGYKMIGVYRDNLAEMLFCEYRKSYSESNQFLAMEADHENPDRFVVDGEKFVSLITSNEDVSRDYSISRFLQHFELQQRQFLAVEYDENIRRNVQYTIASVAHFLGLPSGNLYASNLGKKRSWYLWEFKKTLAFDHMCEVVDNYDQLRIYVTDWTKAQQSQTGMHVLSWMRKVSPQHLETRSCWARD